MGPFQTVARVLAWAPLLLCACGLQAPAVGEPLPDVPGVAEATYVLRLRHTDLRPVHVLFPSDTGGHALPAEGGGRRPALVFIQGGAVKTQGYRWLAEALARQGYVVALPEHAADLAFFEIDNGREARALLVDPPAGSVLDGVVEPERIAVAGHSLGGVVAGKLALSGGFHALAFLASFPDSADDAGMATLGMPSLFLAGRLDCSAKLSQVQEGAAKPPSPTALVVLDGVTHYEFTGDATPDLKGCPPALPLDAAHERISRALRVFLDAALSPAGGTGAEGLGQVEGAEVTAR